MLRKNTRKIDYRLHCAGWRKLKEHLSYNLDGANLLTKRAMDIYEEFIDLWHKKFRHEAVVYDKSEVMKKIEMSGKSSTTWCDAIRRLEVIGLIKVQPYKDRYKYKSICRVTPLDNIYKDWKAEFQAHRANDGKEFILIDFERIKAEQYKGFERGQNKSKYFDTMQEKLFGMKSEQKKEREQTTENEKAKQAVAALFQQAQAAEEENEPQEETLVAESITLRENHEELSQEEKKAIFFCETLNEEMYANHIEPFELKKEEIKAMEYLIGLSAEMEHSMVENARRWVSIAANNDENLRQKFKPTILIAHYHCELLNAFRFSVGLAYLPIGKRERMDMRLVENLCHEKGLKITDFFASAAKEAKKDKKFLQERLTPSFLKGSLFERFAGGTHKDNPNTLSNGTAIPKDADGSFIKNNLLNHKDNKADLEKVKALWAANGWVNTNGKWQKNE